MGDDSSSRSFASALKEEVSMLIDAMTGESEIETNNSKTEDINEDLKPNMRLAILTSDQVREIAKELLESRQAYNQALEKIKDEMEEVQAQMESIELVGGSVEDSQQKLADLSQEGQNFSEKLEDLDVKLKRLRDFENQVEN